LFYRGVQKFRCMPGTPEEEEKEERGTTFGNCIRQSTSFGPLGLTSLQGTCEFHASDDDFSRHSQAGIAPMLSASTRKTGRLSHLYSAYWSTCRQDTHSHL
jgi:hypothetical protein